jgi:hypothetical protein
MNTTSDEQSTRDSSSSGLSIQEQVFTSVIGGSLIPIAYFTFLLMMNSKQILGAHRPEGTRRIIWNVLMIFATAVAKDSGTFEIV